jgi:hypothetical protein
MPTIAITGSELMTGRYPLRPADHGALPPHPPSARARHGTGPIAYDRRAAAVGAAAAVSIRRQGSAF